MHRQAHESWCSARLCCARSLGFRRLFLCASTVLMRPHDRAVDHGVLIVRIARQHLIQLLPHAALGPARKSRVNLDRVPETLRKVSPRYPGAISIKDRLHKQPIVLGGHSDVTLPARQYILDPVPLIVPKPIAAHLSVANQLTPYESRDNPLGNPLIEGRP